MEEQHKNVHGPGRDDKDCREAEPGSLIGEAQLLLAEKRTSLATTRTGIAVLVLPVSVVSLLVATSKLYDISQVAHLAYPLLALCALLLCVGGYLVFRSIRNIRLIDSHLRRLKRCNPNLAHLLD